MRFSAKIIASNVNFLVNSRSVAMVMMMMMMMMTVSSSAFRINIVLNPKLQIDLNLNPLYFVVLLLRQQLAVCLRRVGLAGRYAGVQ